MPVCSGLSLSDAAESALLSQHAAANPLLRQLQLHVQIVLSSQHTGFIMCVRVWGCQWIYGSMLVPQLLSMGDVLPRCREGHTIHSQIVRGGIKTSWQPVAE